MNTQILLEDPITKEEVDYIELKTKRGKETADIVLLAHQENRHRNFEETKRCQVIHNKSKNKSLYQSQPYIKSEKEIAPSNDKIFEPEKKIVKPFGLGISGNFTLTPEIMKGLGIATGLYLVLIQQRTKNSYPGDRLKIYERYWKKGVIATSTTRPELCRRLGIKSEGTITNYTHQLERNKIIKIEELKRYETFDGQPHNVYILGTHEGKKNERFYIDDLY